MSRPDFGEPRTLLQSGNVVFIAGKEKRAALEAKIAGALADEMGVAVEVLVRTPAEIEGGARRQPACPRRRRPTRATSSSCSSRRRSTRRARISSRHSRPAAELVRPGREEVYLYYPPPAGIGQSKLTGAVIEKALRTVGTARNWTTLTKILALAETLEAETGAR